MSAAIRPRPIRRLRWWIGALLFASTTINYIDRQTLSALAPFLKLEYHWTNTDFATVLIAFRIAYTIGQSVCGRLLDHLGTRRGLSLTVAFYSTVAAATALAHGIVSFRCFRFLLGAGESANWPGATKAVSEWFPARERGWAVALFDSGSAIGGAVAPFIVLGIYRWFGSWRPAFLLPPRWASCGCWCGAPGTGRPRSIHAFTRRNSPTFSADARRRVRQDCPRYAGSGCCATARPGAS